MQFDPRRRVYVKPNGSVVSPSELRELIESYIEREKQEVDAEAQRLIAETITAAMFFDWLRDKIKEIHGAAGMVAYGGEDEMNAERWARIGQKVSSESAFANAFEREFVASEQVAKAIVSEAVDALESAGAPLSPSTRRAIEEIVRSTPGSEIPAAAESLGLDVEAAVAKEAFERAATSERIGHLIFGQTPNRASLYMESIYSTYENSARDRESDAGVISGRRITEEDSSVCDGCEAAATEDFIPLDEILDIGGAECMSNCRCTIEFDYSGIQPLTIERSIYAPGFA